MSKHLFKLMGIRNKKIGTSIISDYVEISKWGTVEDALAARSLAYKEQDECMRTGEQTDYVNFIILVEY
jgi:hypothetical protein